MNDIKNTLEKYIEEFSDYFNRTKRIIIVILDKDLNISFYNN